MRLLATCVCDRLIVDKMGAHSLIAIMSNADIAITPPAGGSERLPPNAMFPKEWWIFSMWEPASGDVGKEFDQIIQVYWPNGDKILDGKLTFKTDDRTSYNSYQVLGFPVGQEGKVKILTWVEEQGRALTDPFPYYITIKYLPEGQYPQGTPQSRGIFSIPQ
jgi:hypothetical protein